MEKLNMAKMNTLIKKGYLLAGVVMAANMFAVNEMKASQKQNDPNSQTNSQTFEEKDKEVKDIPIKNGGKKAAETQSPQSILGFLLYYENTINLVGGLALSGANNYFKWWDYNPGGYLNFRIGCLGWRSKRLLDIFQFDINLNLIRGISWSIPHIINLIMTKGSGKGEKTGNFSWSVFFFKDILRGFTSMPLTVHFSNFSISISLDSIIWGIIGKILELKYKKEGEKEGEKLQGQINDQPLIDKKEEDKNPDINLDMDKDKEETKKEEVKNQTGNNKDSQINDETVNKENENKIK